MKKKTSKADILLFSIFCAIILFFSIAIFIFPKNTFSQKENRALANTPKLSLSTLLSGDFFDELNFFYSDHIPLRDSFTALHALSELSIGKGQSNSVIIGKDGTLIPLSSHTQKNELDELYSFMSSRDNTHLYVAPRTIDVFEDELPTLFDKENPKKLLHSIKGEAKEDMDELLSAESNTLYYKTDHHWTSEGAYFAYRQICKRMEIEPFEEEYFSKETVSEDFYGTSFSKSGLPAFLVKPDKIVLYRYEQDKEITVLNRDTNKISKGFYSLDALKTTDKYRTFLGGNYSHLSIYKNDGQKREKLLLIKDSYANSVLPFLSLHFDVEMIDPRYCTRSYLREQIKSNDYDMLLILMGIDTLIS